MRFNAVVVIPFRDAKGRETKVLQLGKKEISHV